MSRLQRTLLSLFIVGHLLMMVGSLGKTTFLGAIRTHITKPYERIFGVYQTWNMFAPRPATAAAWGTVRGLTDGGETIELAPLSGPPDTSVAVQWVYQRRSKLERTMHNQSGTNVFRSHVAAWHCRGQLAAGTPLQEVWLGRVRQPIAHPYERDQAPATPTTEILRKHRCAIAP